MKKLIIGLMAFSVPLLLWAAAGDRSPTAAAQVNFALPRDMNSVALHDESLGLPYFSEAVTLSSSTPTVLMTLPTSGNNAGRQWRKIMARNPDSAKFLYLCFGGASSCATKMMKVPTSSALFFDGMYFGPLNTITTIWGWLDSSGANVIPEITVW